MHWKPFITSRTEQNSALFVECVSQLFRIQNHFLQNKNHYFEYPFGAAVALKTQSKPIYCPSFLCPFYIPQHSQNRLLNIFLCICLLTIFHGMGLYLLYLVYFYFYMKMGLWIYFYLICFMLSFVDLYFCNKKERFLIPHFLFVSSYIQSWTLEIGILTLSNINLHFEWFLLPPQPINNVRLSETCVKAEIISIVNKGRSEMEKYSKIPLDFHIHVQDKTL